MAWIEKKDITAGAVQPEHMGLYVENAFAGDLSPGTLVYVSTHDTGSNNLFAVPKITKADADAAAPANVAKYVVTRTIKQDGFGLVYKFAVLRDLDTSAAGAAGDAWYLTTTAGVGGAAAPVSAASVQQRVGTVRVKSSTVGEVVFDLLSFGINSYGNSGLLPGVLSADAAGRALMAPSYFNVATVDDKFAADSIGEDRLTANELNARVLASVAAAAAGALAAGNLGALVVLPLTVVDAASGNQDFSGLPYKFRVLAVGYIKTGGAGNAGNSITIHNGITGNAISAAINSATDTAMLFSNVIDDAFWDIAAAATIRAVTVRAGGNNAALVFLIGHRVA